MWDWDSVIVLPLVAKGLDRSLAAQRERVGGAPSTDDEAAWEGLREQGHGLLHRYLTWAPTVDRFSPIRV